MTVIGFVNVECNKCGGWRRVPLEAVVSPAKHKNAVRFTVKTAGEKVGEVYVSLRSKDDGEHVCTPRTGTTKPTLAIVRGED